MKKRTQTCFLALLICLFPISTPSQDSPKAEKVDEWAFDYNCEDMMARLDIFNLRLFSESDSSALIAIKEKEKDKLKIIKREAMILNYIVEQGGISSDRVKFVRLRPGHQLIVELWVVPKGASLPNLEEHDVDFKLSSDTKPFVVIGTGSKGTWDGICPSNDRDKTEAGFAETLAANPLSKGHFVVFGPSKKDFEVTKNRLLSSFAEIGRKRLRFFWVRDKYPGIEYWIVPKKAK